MANGGAEVVYSTKELLALVNETVSGIDRKMDAFILNIEGRLSTIEAQAPFRAQVAGEVGELSRKVRTLEEDSIREDAFRKERRRIYVGAVGASGVVMGILEGVRAWLG